MWRSWQLPATVLLLLLAAAPGPGCSGSLLSKEGGEANGTFTVRPFCVHGQLAGAVV